MGELGNKYVSYLWAVDRFFSIDFDL
ncbi:MAG: hypothetical protein UY18_C0046G0001, partial [Microgenomates group bacterium GW2011_GWF2_47_9]